MRKLMYRDKYRVYTYCVVLISCLFITNVFALTDHVDHIGIEVPVSCTMSGTGMNSHTASIPNGTSNSSIGETTLKAFCNDNQGFSIYAVGFTNNEYGSNVLTDSNLGSTYDILTGTDTSGNRSTWAMKLTTNSEATYPVALQNSFNNFHNVPTEYMLVAKRESGTDSGSSATGSTITTAYQAYISSSQPSGLYKGQVKYVLVHPGSGTPHDSPITCEANKICYSPNANDYEGTMGMQSVDDDNNTIVDGSTITLLASNYSRRGYGFAGWTDTYDYKTNKNAHFYGPQETITAPEGTVTNGLSLYAVWVKSVGFLQDSTKVAELCGSSQNSLTAAPTDGTADLSSVSALTDQRGNETYAIAKLADGKCWMIENLRLDNTVELTIQNTNNPLNDSTIVTLKHNYTDAITHNTLSAPSNVIYNAETAPDGWCTDSTAACDNQSRLRTTNVASRAYNPTTNFTLIYSYGNYYNWYSTTAGRGTFEFSTNNNSVSGDICPLGWHLPKGGDKSNEADNEFWGLITVGLNNGIKPINYEDKTYPYYGGNPEGKTVSMVIRSYPNNFIYSGVYGGAYLTVGAGSYWSSTVKNASYAYGLFFNDLNVVPGTDNVGKQSGRTFRCIEGNS